MPMKTAAALLFIAVLTGCASSSPTAVDGGGAADAVERREVECEGGSERAVADFFPNSPQNQSAEFVGERSAEAAAVQLLTFGRNFDPAAYEVDTSEQGG